jgi:hypothetical protein
MQQFVHRKNVENYKRRLAQPLELAERAMLLALLAEEEAKEPGPVTAPQADQTQRDVAIT